MILIEQVVKCRANVVIVIDDQQYGHLMVISGKRLGSMNCQEDKFSPSPSRLK